MSIYYITHSWKIVKRTGASLPSMQRVKWAGMTEEPQSRITDQPMAPWGKDTQEEYKVKQQALCSLVRCLQNHKVHNAVAVSLHKELYHITRPKHKPSHTTGATITLCIWEKPRRVFFQTVETHMKCSIMLHFIRVYTVWKGKKRSSDKRIQYF